MIQALLEFKLLVHRSGIDGAVKHCFNLCIVHPIQLQSLQAADLHPLPTIRCLPAGINAIYTPLCRSNS